MIKIFEKIDTEAEKRQLKGQLSQIDSQLEEESSLGLRLAKNKVLQRLNTLKASDEFFK